MESKNRNKAVHCEICNKNMRSDTLKRHLKSKKCIPSNLKVYEKKSINSAHLQRKERNLELE